VAHPQQLSISQSKEVFLTGFEEQQRPFNLSATILTASTNSLQFYILNREHSRRIFQ